MKKNLVQKVVSEDEEIYQLIINQNQNQSQRLLLTFNTNHPNVGKGNLE